jgi:hypothetical protein
MLFLAKIVWSKRKCETMSCHDATAGSFVAKVRGEVFAHFQPIAVERHSSMRNCLACQHEFYGTIPFMSKKMMSMLLTLFFACLAFFFGLGLTFRVQLMISSPNACLIIARVSVALLPKFAHNFMLFLCRLHREIVSGLIHGSK